MNKTITLDEREYTVVGVLPQGFEFPDPGSQREAVDALIPLVFTTEQVAQRRGPYYLNVLGRLKSEVTIEQARSHMSALAQRFEREQSGYRGPNGEDGGWRLTVSTLADEFVGKSRRALLVLLGAVGLVLTIACANVGNLILLRAARRRKELAIRAALGASRWRIVRQLLIEGLLLTLFGAAVGLLLARWAIDLLPSLGSVNLPRAHEISIDRTVLAFTSLIALASSAFLGLAPALRMSKLDLQTALRDSGSSDGWRNQWSSILVVAEVALSLVLLTGAGLLINSFFRLQAVYPEVAVEHLLTAEINLSPARYRSREAASSFYNELTQRLISLPGVQAASFGTQQVLNARTQNDPFAIEGRPLNPRDLTSASWQIVGPDYFRTIGLPLVAGRDIEIKDMDQASPPVTVINQRMANRYWPNENPIGRRVTLGLPRPENPWITIVGIAKDLPRRLDSTPEPDWYLSRSISDAQLNRYVLVRTAADPASLGNSLRTTVLAMDRNQPITSLRTAREVVNETVAPRKFNTVLLSVFAAVALGLAALGIYSVISYAVAMRAREIGIRMALGAERSSVMRLVLKQGMTPALVGSLIGLAAAFGLTRFLAGLLFEVSSTDPLTYVAVSVFLLSIALLACYIPARRATEVDPLVVLKYE
jgi:putative ABC transport system permease protein